MQSIQNQQTHLDFIQIQYQNLRRAMEIIALRYMYVKSTLLFLILFYIAFDIAIFNISKAQKS